MLDPKCLRSDIEQTAKRLAARGFNLDVAAFSSLEEKRKTLQSRTQDLQNERNVRSKSIGKAKAQGEDIAPLLAEVGKLGDELDAAKAELSELLEEINTLTQGIPNLPHESVPEGKDEDDNVEISRWGEPRTFDFEVKDHVDVAEGLNNGLDFATASKLTGSRNAWRHCSFKPCACSVHARYPYSRAWLSGNVRALSCQCRQPIRYRSVA